MMTIDISNRIQKRQEIVQLLKNYSSLLRYSLMRTTEMTCTSQSQQSTFRAKHPVQVMALSNNERKMSPFSPSIEKKMWVMMPTARSQGMNGFAMAQGQLSREQPLQFQNSAPSYTVKMMQVCKTNFVDFWPSCSMDLLDYTLQEILQQDPNKSTYLNINTLMVFMKEDQAKIQGLHG